MQTYIVYRATTPWPLSHFLSVYKMRSFLLVLLFSTLAFGATKQCYSCVSEDLNQWYLTGLPQHATFPTQDPYCDVGTQSRVPLWDTVDCDGPCVTLFLKEKNSLNAKVFAVRGCSDKLGLPPQKHLSDTTNRYCEFDDSVNHPTVQTVSTGTNVVSQSSYVMFYELCAGSNNCNSGVASNTDDYSMSPAERTLTCNPNRKQSNNQSNQCYRDDGNGKVNTACQKTYCLKSEVTVGKTTAIRKSCTNVNPFGVDQYCGDYEFPQAVAGIATFDAKVRTCYCRDKAYCNGTSALTILSAVVIAALAAFLR
uniref:Protein sleepless n=1 Tax=Steinernema glaseri TaxID=37863 RepID=A0A1I7ZTJ5_9BILA